MAIVKSGSLLLQGVNMKKRLFVFCIVFLSMHILFAQENSDIYDGKEIENRIGAVKAANPGDYILLPSGKKYVLTKEEISIARGEFDYTNLTGVETTVDENGTEIVTISSAHIAYVFPDGQSTHILKTSVSFTAFMRHIRHNFFPVYYIDSYDDVHEYVDLPPQNFSVFRSSVQYQTISDGIEELQMLSITVFNFENENKYIRYCSAPEMVYGNIDPRGAYKPVGESHIIEFDVE
jgi:hypothetical protein